MCQIIIPVLETIVLAIKNVVKEMLSLSMSNYANTLTALNIMYKNL